MKPPTRIGLAAVTFLALTAPIAACSQLGASDPWEIVADAFLGSRT